MEVSIQGGHGCCPDGEPPDGNRRRDGLPDAFMKALLAGQKAIKDGEMDKAEAAYAIAMELRVKHARETPSERASWQVAAAECMARHDWPGALGFQLRVHQDSETRANPGLLCKSCIDLAELHLLMGNPDDADEAVGLECDAPGSETVQAHSWMNRARCRMAFWNVAGAESDLEASEEVLMAREWPRLMGGMALKQADWWAVKARVRKTYGDNHGATEACRMAIAGYQQSAGTWAKVRWASMLRLLGELQSEAGEDKDARESMAEATRIHLEMRLPACLGRG